MPTFICIPITPVEPTSTFSGLSPVTSATALAVSRQIFIPSSPVQALAIPELTTTALTLPSDDVIFLSQITGAALTTFDVYTPAASHNSSLYIRAMSVLPSYLIPAA